MARLNARMSQGVHRQVGAILGTRIRRHVACALRRAYFLLKGSGLGRNALACRAQGFERGAPFRAAYRGHASDGLIPGDIGVWQTKSPPGPAGRWFIDRLKQMPVEMGKVSKPPVIRNKARRSAKTWPDAATFLV